jgi:hypothetical protein
MAGQAIWIVFPMLLVLQHALTKWFVTSGLPRDRFKLQELQHGEVSGDVAANTGAASRRVYWTMLYLSAFIALFALETLLLGAGTVGWILLLIAGLQLAYFGYAIRVSR